MKDGIKCESVKVRVSSGVFDFGYKARIAIYENGKRLYSVMGEVVRVSRGDALMDARNMAHDLKVQNFLEEA